MRDKIGGVLSKEEIKSYSAPDRPIAKRLFISPILDPEQIGDTSVDLRLGHHFLVPRPTKMGVLDTVNLHKEGEAILRQSYGEIHVPYGKFFTLNPGKSVQVGTLEYIGIPDDLEGDVYLRASVSNLPILANGARVHPGFRGILTFTLTSTAEIVIKLYPGMRFAEIQFFTLESPIKVPKSSRYHTLTRPIPPVLYKDSDLELLGPTVEPHILGIVSTIASGRTTVINYLMEVHGFASFSLAQMLRLDASTSGTPPLRSNLQALGKYIRSTKGDAYLAEKLRTSVNWLSNKHSKVIVDGFKHRDEVKEFRKQRSFSLVAVNAPFDERWNRLRGKKRIGDPEDKSKFIEQDEIDRGLKDTNDHGQEVDYLVSKMADYSLINDGLKDELFRKIDNLVDGFLFPHDK